MRAVGIIAEYNPFHKGHAWQIARVRELTEADHVIVVMSGNFVQRGAPACADKYLRTCMALEGGADFVFEIPTVWSCAAAEDYAQAGIRLLHELGSVQTVCFGTEAGRLETLRRISDVLVEEPELYRLALRGELAGGRSFPEARAVALEECLPGEEDLQQILAQPNNILGLEYLNALKKIGSPMEPVTVERRGGYHAPGPRGREEFASASAVRRILERGEGGDWPEQKLRDWLPEYVLGELAAHWGSRLPVVWEDFQPMLAAQLLLSEGELTEFQDYTQELANRTRRVLDQGPSFAQLAEGLKTRNYTRTRVQRALLHALLRIRSEDVRSWKEENMVPYARLLGFRRSHDEWLRRTASVSRIPVLTRLSADSRALSPQARRMLELDIRASHLYRMAVQMKFGCKTYKNEFRQGVLLYS